MIWWDYVIIALFVIIVAYSCVRVGSIAYFKTKMEHFRSVMKLTQGEKE